jgi:hypothetical protein
MENKIALHSIKLEKTGKNDAFVEKFNNCSDLFSLAFEDNISEEESKKRFEDFMAYKYCLEQGII